MDSISDYLHGVPMFSALEPRDLRDLAAMTVVRKLGKGEIVFNEGDEARGFYLLSEGRLKIHRTTVDGREQTLHLISPGETFAEVALFTGTTYPASAQALEESEVLFFPRENLTRLIERNPRFSLALIAGFARWVRQFKDLVGEYYKAVPSRLAGYLLAEALRQEPSALADGARVRLEVNKTEIASLLGTISATLSRALGQLRDAGLIEVRDREVVIRDLSKLRDVASGKMPGDV